MDSVVRNVLAGEVDAFALIVRQYQKSVWQVVVYALRDRAATEDMVQQVFVSAFKALDSYQPGRDVGKWIRGIARNAVRQEIRRRVREDRRLGHYEARLSAMAGVDGAWEERQARMRNAVDACRKLLAPAAAEAVQLRYDLALEFGEVACRLGRTVEATRMFLSRIRETLRLCVEKRMARS